MKDIDLLILGWHQVYLTANAGGYVRLKEFLKRMPKDIRFLLLDNKPTLFSKEVSSQNIHVYDTPNFIKPLRNKAFLFWLLLETILAGFVVYKEGDKFLQNTRCKVLYVPIGEFPQLYLPSIFLKKKYPHIKLIVDILNFELPDKNAYTYFKKLRKSGISVFRAVTTIVMFYIGYFLTQQTLKFADYVFTVSPELVDSIKKVYKKTTIDFTPSGVNSKLSVKSKRKKYLSAYVGRITIQKGIMDLLDTWTLVVKKKKDAKLAIVGHIDNQLYESSKHFIKKHNLEKNIFFLGQVDDKKKFEILSESESFLHLARYEPLFPVIGILEGLASGLYTIIYDMPVVDSQIKNLKSEKSLAIVKNGDYHKVSDVLIQFALLSPEKKKNITQSAQKFAQRYDWDVIAAKEFKIIKKLIKS